MFRKMFRAALREVLFCLLMATLSGAMSELSPAQSFTLDLPLQATQFTTHRHHRYHHQLSPAAGQWPEV